MRTETCQQAPVRNESVVGAQVYSHSGEFSPRALDIALSGRGPIFQFIRKYRSSHSRQSGSVGNGWTFTYAKKLERDGSSIVYHDGLGRLFRFPAAAKNSYASPDGFYGVLTTGAGKIVLQQRHGNAFVFEKPEAGGRLIAIEDRHGNALGFQYAKGSVRVVDSFGRKTTIALAGNRVVEVRDYADRVWRYEYDKDGCLLHVIQPPTDDFPAGTKITYGYDAALRLVSITDPKGQCFLRNEYDDQGRVRRQNHGNGYFEFEYEQIATTEDGSPVYRTKVRQKNGARLALKHNAAGQVVERTSSVSAESLSEEDRRGSQEKTIPLATSSRFNRHGEMVGRVSPAGNSAQWSYDEDNPDPRARGNLLQVTRKPAPGVESDQDEITTRHTYEPEFQRVKSIVDPRGHKTSFKYDDRNHVVEKVYPKVGSKQLVERFEYNAAGQLVRFTDAFDALVQYHYYPPDHPTGVKGRKGVHSEAKKPGGYLARMVRDPSRKGRHFKNKPANLVTEFVYDSFGNISTIRDGKGNPTMLEYNTHNRLVRVTSRAKHQFKIRYDANDNPVEVSTSFERALYHAGKDAVIRKSSELRTRVGYNILNHIVERAIDSDGEEIVETFARDANENVIRHVQPMGNVAEYRYDERNRLIETRRGLGTREETTVRYTHTPNGQPHSTTDGRGGTTKYDYDGFHRFRGFTNAAGAIKRQSFDAAGNIIRVEVIGDLGLADERGETGQAKTSSSLLLFEYTYDELNRRVRVDRAWRDPITGQALGKSRISGKDGTVSAVVEYADNHRPAKVFYETGNVLSFEYDGANRLAAVSDATGNSTTLEYDENSNPVRIDRVRTGRVHDITVQLFDESDRLIKRRRNSDPPASFAYNALGFMSVYKNAAGAATEYLYDAFGRWSGIAAIAASPRLKDRRSTKGLLTFRLERDRKGRIESRINAAGHRTRYLYDAHNRQTGVIYPDRTFKYCERDGNGNVIRIVDANGNRITNHFDSLNRLFERRIQPGDGGKLQVETFRYDGLNRLVAAINDSARVVRRYDSLSRLLEELQNGRSIRYRYDAGGNCIHLTYPSGQEVHTVYDLRGRVSEIRDEANSVVTRYGYGSGHRPERQTIANVLEAAFSYNRCCDDCLMEVVYRSIKTGTMVEGSRYTYDTAGNRIQEAQLHRGKNFGERYFYDSVNRVAAAQYGVSKLSKPGSKFEREVLYELSPVATWKKKVIRDTKRNTVQQLDGITNEKDAYIALGNRRFEHDANGNRILEVRPDDKACTEKRYRYDYANRVVEVECLDSGRKATHRIEYFYDALRRLALKRVTDAQGKRDLIHVWRGRRFIEEYEDANLSKSFVYGARVPEPVRMKRHTADGAAELFYMLNGRGFVTALSTSDGIVTERYAYDVFRVPLLSEVNGKPVPEDKQDSSSPAGNPLLIPEEIWEPDEQSYHGSAGSTYDPTTGEVLGYVTDPDDPRSWQKTLLYECVANANKDACVALGLDEPFDDLMRPGELDLLPPGSDPTIDREYPDDPPPIQPPEPVDPDYPDDVVGRAQTDCFGPLGCLPEIPGIFSGGGGGGSSSGGAGGGGGDDGGGSGDGGTGNGGEGNGEGGSGGETGTVEAMPGTDIVVGVRRGIGVGPRGRARGFPGIRGSDPRITMPNPDDVLLHLSFDKDSPRMPSFRVDYGPDQIILGPMGPAADFIQNLTPAEATALLRPGLGCIGEDCI